MRDDSAHVYLEMPLLLATNHRTVSLVIVYFAGAPRLSRIEIDTSKMCHAVLRAVSSEFKFSYISKGTMMARDSVRGR